MIKIPGSLLSNMENKDRDLIVEAIKLSSFSDIVYIDDVATYGNGKILRGNFGVHTKDRQKDHHEFWEKFDELKRKQNENNTNNR